MKKCNICKKIKELSDYHKNGKQLNGNIRYKPYCKDCTVFYRRSIHWYKIKKILNSSKLSCDICGYDKNISALEFHHLDDDNKESEISRFRCWESSLQRYEEEIDKCALVCSNCHREYHNPEHDQDKFFNSENYIKSIKYYN